MLDLRPGIYPSFWLFLSVSVGTSRDFLQLIKHFFFFLNHVQHQVTMPAIEHYGQEF